MSITRRGAVLLAAVALTALILPGPLAVILFAAVLIAVATDAWQVRRVPEVEMEVPPILSRGVEARLEVTTSPSARLKVAQSPDLRIQPNEAPDGTLVAAITALRRGDHEIQGPATIRTGPLGLGCWFHRSSATSRVVVYPDMPAARRIATEVRLGQFGDPSRRSRGPLGIGTELESIRDYLPDDDIRQVNWRATARVGSPMSNTFRIEQEREILLLLDTGRLMSAPVGDGTERTRLDVAVDSAAAVAAVADVVGDRVGLVAFDDRIRRKLSPRRDGASAVVEAIHDLEPTSGESNFEIAFRSVAHSKRSFVLVLTDLLEETASRPLVNAMPVLARHHAVTVAGVEDPAIAAAMRTPATATTEAYRTAVAVDVENSRRRVTSILAGYGATVVDAAPSRLARECVAAYLHAKRRARL